jgi:hypothetical protein
MQGHPPYQDDLLNSLVGKDKNWTKTSNDTYIDHIRKTEYDNGFRAGQKAEEHALINALKENFGKTTSIAKKLYAELNKIKFTCSEIRLKVNGIGSFEMIGFIDKDSYLTTKRKEAYKIVRKYEQQNDSLFSINISFFPVDDREIDLEALNSEGFNISYAKPKTR